MGASLGTTASRGQLRRARRQQLSEINVTPFVDVMLVLLIVFMVAAPLLTVGVPVNLPSTNAAVLNDQTEPIVITVDRAGKLFLQETELDSQKMIAQLQAITHNDPNVTIFVRGDKDIVYGKVMQIMGNIAAAGFQKVSLLAELPKPSR